MAHDTQRYDKPELTHPTVKYLREMMATIKKMERTLLIHPEQEERAIEAARGLPHITIKTSQFVTLGTALLINENALEPDYSKMPPW